MLKNAEVRKARCVLSLPGPRALCAKLMLKLGMTTKETPQYFIDHNLQNALALKKRVAELGLLASVQYGSLCNFMPPVKIDMANLDTEAGFGIGFGYWLQDRLGPMLADDAYIFLTLCSSSRNAEPVKFFKYFETHHRKQPVFENHETEIREKWPEISDAAVRSLLLVACALCDFHVAIDQVFDYADDNRCPMHLICIKTRRRLATEPPERPSFHDLLEGWKGVDTVRQYLEERSQQNPATPHDFDTSNFKKLIIPHKAKTMKNKAQTSTSRTSTKTKISPDEYLRRGAKAGATTARGKRDAIIDELFREIKSDVCNEAKVAVLLKEASDLTYRIGDHDARERALSTRLKDPSPALPVSLTSLFLPSP
jgi:hypothetical protein